MVMKVNNNLDPRQVLDIYLKRLEKTHEKEREESKNLQESSFPADVVEISNRARELQLYRTHLKEIPEARAELVQSVKRELAEGTYRIDAEEIAAGILKERRLDKLV